MLYNTRLSRPITTEWTSCACVRSTGDGAKSTRSWALEQNYSSPVAWSRSTSLSIPAQHKTHDRHRYPNRRDVARGNRLSNTARNVSSQVQVLFHVDSTSDALFGWSTARSLFDALEAFYANFPIFACQKAFILWKNVSLRAPFLLFTKLLGIFTLHDI